MQIYIKEAVKSVLAGILWNPLEVNKRELRNASSAYSSNVFGVKLVSVLILINKLANKNNAGYHILSFTL